MRDACVSSGPVHGRANASDCYDALHASNSDGMQLMAYTRSNLRQFGGTSNLPPALSLSLLSHTALTPPCPLSRGIEPRRFSRALRRCAPGSSRARPPPNKAGKTCRASMGSVSVQTAVWRSCVWPHSHALASHICGTRWSSWAVFLASVCCSWACSLSVDHLSSCPLRVRAQPVALFRVPGASVPLSDAFHNGSTTVGTPLRSLSATAVPPHARSAGFPVPPG
jgi:hypothetical protein